MLIDEHGGALEYDLMTRTPYTLDDLGGRLSWRALFNFVRHVGYDSELYREINPDDELRPWLDGSIVAALLADIFDLENARAHAGSRKKPKPYPRPWRRDKTVQRIGSEPIRAGDFERWWTSKN